MLTKEQGPQTAEDEETSFSRACGPGALHADVLQTRHYACYEDGSPVHAQPWRSPQARAQTHHGVTIAGGPHPGRCKGTKHLERR